MLLEQGKVDGKQLELKDDLCSDKISFHSFVLGTTLTTPTKYPPKVMCANGRIVSKVERV